MAGKRLVAIIEAAAGLYHLLLAEDRKLISSKFVLVVLDELVALSIGSGRRVDGLDGSVVQGGLGSSRVTSSVPTENLNESDLTLRWDVCADL